MSPNPTHSRRFKLRAPIVFLALSLLVCLWIPLLNAEPTEVPVAPEEQVQTGQEGLPEEPLGTASTAPEGNGNSNNNNSKNHNHAGSEEQHCAWGTACHPEYVEEAAGAGGTPSNTNKINPEEAKKSSGNANTSNSASASASGNIPFVHHHNANSNHHGNIVPPPEGFAISARVYTDPNDKLAHFTDDKEGSHITLPYWECGATGSTTSPLPVKDAYFRHALSGSKPHVWSGTEYGPHPQLVVVLADRMEMTLNSGETKHLKAGDVVLLEDVVSGGHKLRALEGEGFDMTYLLLTLPQHYHHVGRDRMALKRVSTEKTKQSPCTNQLNQQNQQAPHSTGNAFVNRQQVPQQEPLSSSSWENILSGDNVADGEVAPLREPKIRKLLLGVVGVSVSALFADFLGKVAPLWLAVGIGGTCFVVGGTFGIVQGGDYLCSEFEMWQERKRLDVPSMGADDDIDIEEEKIELEKAMPMATASAAS